MLSGPNFACCFDAPKAEGQEDGEHCAYQHHREVVSNLPSRYGISKRPLRLYQGFWFLEAVLVGVLSLCSNLRHLPSDVFLASFPKSGTTWLKALVFAICHRSSSQSTSSNGHCQLLSRHPQDCSPNLELLFASPRVPDLDVLPSPRQLSTHIPYSILPKSVRSSDSPCRIVYLCREPKDTLVSTYHFVNGLCPNKITTRSVMPMESVELFCEGVSMCGPVWEHQLEYWRESQRRPEKVLFLKYEDMMAEPEASVRKLAEFMGRPFSVEEEESGMVAEVVGLCSFENLSELKVNKVGVWQKGADFEVKNSSFFRKGKVGDWREHLSVEMAEMIDAVSRDKLHGTGLSHWRAPAGESAHVEEI